MKLRKDRRKSVIIDLYSKRKNKAEMSGKTKFYEYDKIPEPFRNQVIYIWQETFNDKLLKGEFLTELEKRSQYSLVTVLADHPDFWSNLWLNFWEDTHYELAKEHGKTSLSNEHEPFTNIQNYFLKEGTPTEKLLDIIEYTFSIMKKKALNSISKVYEFYERDICLDSELKDTVNNEIENIFKESIKELNTRFEEHSLGYALTSNGQIIRKDSDLIHNRIVEPAMNLLHDHQFTNALNEFSKAHKHYLKGRYNEAINEAHKSFESTMKNICDEKDWSYEKVKGAANLIDIVFKNGLIKDCLNDLEDDLKKALKTGLPKIRNKTAHGQGKEITKVPRSLVQYALHLAATNIVFLVESYKATL